MSSSFSTTPFYGYPFDRRWISPIFLTELFFKRLLFVLIQIIFFDVKFYFKVSDNFFIDCFYFITSAYHFCCSTTMYYWYPYDRRQRCSTLNCLKWTYWTKNKILIELPELHSLNNWVCLTASASQLIIWYELTLTVGVWVWVCVCVCVCV